MVSATRHIEAMDKINDLVSVRERTAKEVRSRLATYGFADDEIDDAVETALRVGLINEERYARAFIRGKQHKGWGRGKIVQRLRADGVDDETIDACSIEFSDPEEEFARALHEIERHPSHSKDPYASYMRRLLGKGYSMDIARRAVKEFLG